MILCCSIWIGSEHTIHLSNQEFKYSYSHQSGHASSSSLEGWNVRKIISVGTQCVEPNSVFGFPVSGAWFANTS